MKTNSQPAVMLWTLDLSGREKAPAAWLELLDGQEFERYLRFLRAVDRLSYAAAHALLRTALSQILGLSPRSVVLARDAMGKPFLAPQLGFAIDFSISHTEGMVAVALCEAGKVGVDVEAVDRKNLPKEDFSAFGLSQEETASLAAIPEPEKSAAFIELWTAREAVAKADGRGLSLPFSSIRIDLTRRTAEIAMDAPGTTRHWRLWCERPTARHCLAVAGPQEGELIKMGTSI